MCHKQGQGSAATILVTNQQLNQYYYIIMINYFATHQIERLLSGGRDLISLHHASHGAKTFGKHMPIL